MQNEAKYDEDRNALSHSLALTAGYLRLRMSMEDVPLSLNTRVEPAGYGR